MPEYRPLEDDHLHDFFLRSETLKRLRANGEITENNDVICTLKDFNQFRRELDVCKRSLDLQKALKKALDASDQRLVQHAYKIEEKTMADDEFMGITARERRNQHDNARQERAERLWQRTLRRMHAFQKKQEIQRVIWDEKKMLRDLNIKHHNEIVAEMIRRKSIKNKIQSKIKMLRSKHVLLMENKRRKQERYDMLLMSWQKRLAERTSRRKYMYELLEKANQERTARIQMHIQRHQHCWSELQDDLKQRERKNRRSQRSSVLQSGKKTQLLNMSKEPYTEYDSKFESFKELLDDELYYLLSTVVDVENFQLPFDGDDLLYKAAEFIKVHVLRKFKTDLSIESDLMYAIQNRLSSFIITVKNKVMMDAKRVINDSNGLMQVCSIQMACTKQKNQKLSFNETLANISGKGYELHPNVKLRCVTKRSPTPKSSLASILVEAEQTDKWSSNMGMNRMRIIFLEYVFAKFKREVIVGVQNRVLIAIDLYFKGKHVQVRRELLNISDYYMINQISKAILSFAVNKINFNACIFLTINMLSSKIISKLQQYLAKCGCEDTIEHIDVSDSWFLEQIYNLPERTMCRN